MSVQIGFCPNCGGNLVERNGELLCSKCGKKVATLRLLCPLMGQRCSRSSCAWWDAVHKCCAVITIAVALDMGKRRPSSAV